MNVAELLRLLQTQHHETAAHADNLGEQTERLTAALAETEARLDEFCRHPQGHRRPHPSRPRNDPCGDRHRHRQRIVTTFDEHPGEVFRVRDLHERLGLPTDEPSINVTRSRLGRLVRQGLLEQPGRGRYQKRTQRPLRTPGAS
ncbi:type IV toxin-antitoxin system AbiEi family antitoxin domain-containing protein [Embleya sp. MST-111070]|uniref:type IV toxin-antitoxin system AbiEi family antitoxin domain-containing protein n=1 Tax=Embleya sp. MST-111070 TaxID=3398231 RepID=UPI003F7392A4